jgi:hypothetical protein
MLGLAVFPTQTVAGRLSPGTHRTWEGRCHDGAGLVLTAALVGSAAAFALGHSATIQARAFVALVLALSAATTLVLLVAGDPWPGWRQRVLVAAAVLAQTAMFASNEAGRRTT